MEVTEVELLELIKLEPKLVVKIWSEDCPFCKKLTPFFDEVSAQFVESKFVSLKVASYRNIDIKDKDLLLIVKKVAPGESGGLPATLVFENGTLKYKHHGYLEATPLANFIATGEKPEKKVKEENSKKELTFVLTGAQADTLRNALGEVPDKYVHDLVEWLKSIFGPQADQQLKGV